MLRTSVLLSVIFFSIRMLAQTGSTPGITVRTQVFESPAKHEVLQPIHYPNQGILQVSAKGGQSVNFKLFSNDLTLIKEKTVEPTGKLNDQSNAACLLRMGDKTYFLVRDVNKEQEKEGVSCLAFNMDKFDFEEKSKKLFESSSKIARGFFYSGYGVQNDLSDGDNMKYFGACQVVTSQNQGVVMFTYMVRPEERNNNISKERMGIYCFDANMDKRWGDEIQLPYVESRIDKISFFVSNDAKVYLLAKVFDGELIKESEIKKNPNFHLELLVWEQGKTQADIIPVKLDGFIPTSACLNETKTGDILIAGFYAKEFMKPELGAYVLQLNKQEHSTSLFKGHLFELTPASLRETKANGTSSSDGQLNNTTDDNNRNLKIRSMQFDDDGNIILMGEDYITVVSRSGSMKDYTLNVNVYSKDIYVVKISGSGTFWARKIPKYQHHNLGNGDTYSFNYISTKDKLYFFYLDDEKNKNISPGKELEGLEKNHDAYLACVSIDQNGHSEKFSLTGTELFEPDFFIRQFEHGAHDNLIRCSRHMRKNTLVSIGIQ